MHLSPLVTHAGQRRDNPGGSFLHVETDEFGTLTILTPTITRGVDLSVQSIVYYGLQ